MSVAQLKIEKNLNMERQSVGISIHYIKYDS